MASKIIFFALLALAHQSTAASTPAVASDDMVPCIMAYQTVVMQCGADIDLAYVLSGILNIAVQILDNVLAIVTRLLRGILGLVGGILGGGGVQPPKVAVPKDVGSICGMGYAALLTIDRACAKLYPSVYKGDLLSEIYISLILRIGNKEGWDMSGQNYDWCQSDSQLSLEVQIQRAIAILVQVKGGVVGPLVAKIVALLNYILANVGNLTSSLIGTILSYVFSILYDLAIGCGWLSNQDAYAVLQVNISATLQQSGCGSVDPKILRS